MLKAETHSVLASVLRTCRRRGVEIVGALTELLRSGPGHVLNLLAPQLPPTQ